MLDSLASLPCIAAMRPAGFIVGWRNGAAVRNDEFLGRVAAWRNLLRRSAGNDFALYFDDSLEFGAALLGAWQSQKTVWIASDTRAPTCAALAQSVDGFLGEFPSEFSPRRPGSDDAEMHRDIGEKFGAIDGNFPALVVYTSGTTGAAQAIPKRLSQLSSEVATLESVFGPILGDAEIIATVSHQHIYGLLFKVLWPLTAGRAIHARSQHFPEPLAALMATRPCALIASPAHLKRLPDHLAWTGAAQCLRAVFSSGGPLDLDVAQSTASLLGQVPMEVYGSSETGGIAWRQRAGGHDGSWQALPGVAWRIAANESLLEVRSSHLADDDWMRLADRVQEHADGRFTLSGRSDRIAKIEEKRISLDAIEALLAASSLVSEVRILVCGEESGQRQRLAAFVVPSPLAESILADEGKHALNRRLRDLLVGAVEPVALPRRWRYLDQMPVDAQGKTTHGMLLALLDARPRTPSLRLVGQDRQRVEFDVAVPADLFYFDGHFPGTPILPGVVQIDWAIRTGRRHFDLPPRFCAIHALKFHHVIRPNTPFKLELVHDAQKGSLHFRYFSPGIQHSSGRIQFVAEEVADAVADDVSLKPLNPAPH